MNTPTQFKAPALRNPGEEKPAEEKKPKPKQKPKPVGPAALKGTPDARKQAALVLEVLCGLRGPTDAAQAMGIALPRYYLLETRALQGLIEALEPRPRGPGRSPDSEINALNKQISKLKQEVARGQSLVRVAQRSLGLPAPAAQSKQEGKRKPKRPSVRALKAVAALRMEKQEMQPAAAGATP